MTQAQEITEAARLDQEFCRVRRQSESLCQPLSPEDMMVQSCAEASPAKWHLAHTTWFFETFLLEEFLPGYHSYNPEFRWLFNSYYNAVSDQPEKKLRASFSRPGVEVILDYRRYVEEGIRQLLDSQPPQEALRRITLGLNHEQQHQELLITDIKHALWTNPLHPAYLGYRSAARGGDSTAPGSALEWKNYEGGLVEIGFAGEGFAFDNELPRHREYLSPYQLGSQLVSCAEYLQFMEDGGYRRPELWLAAGWQIVEEERWHAPLYWRQLDQEWHIYTMAGEMPIRNMMETPVCHVSYFEADAFAAWAGKRLPMEAEWEVAAQGLPVRGSTIEGNFLESGRLHPEACRMAEPRSLETPLQMFGDVWEWTRSSYLGYPGFQALPGALGEYNGKFMCNQMVLRGGSAATPSSHIRATYRNFFPPATRWQFSGIRLANL